MEEMQNEGLLGFDILDEIEDGESDEDDISKDSEDESDSLAEDEVDQMLEANVANTNKKSQEEIVPQEKLKKLVLEERGGQEFEVLPLGWVSVTHNSGRVRNGFLERFGTKSLTENYTNLEICINSTLY